MTYNYGSTRGGFFLCDTAALSHGCKEHLVDMQHLNLCTGLLFLLKSREHTHTHIPDLFCSPPGVELVNGAWRNLRSGVPHTHCRREAALRWPVAWKRNRLTWGSNCDICSCSPSAPKVRQQTSICDTWGSRYSDSQLFSEAQVFKFTAYSSNFRMYGACEPWNLLMIDDW